VTAKLTLSNDSTKSRQIRHRCFGSPAPREFVGDRAKIEKNSSDKVPTLGFVNMAKIFRLYYILCRPWRNVRYVVTKSKFPGKEIANPIAPRLR